MSNEEKICKIAITVMISKDNATKLRRLVYGLKSKGEAMSISKIIDDALTSMFNDSEWYEDTVKFIEEF